VPLPNPTYIINFTDPLKPAFAIPAYRTNGTDSPISNTLDPNATAANTSVLLYGKGVDNYGERIQENMVNMIEHFAGPTPPVNPIQGQVWFDNNYNTFIGFDLLNNWVAVITPSLYTFNIVSISLNLPIAGQTIIVVEHKQNVSNGDVITVKDALFGNDGSYTIVSSSYASLSDETSIVVSSVLAAASTTGKVFYAPTPTTPVIGQFQYDPATDELTVFSGSTASGSTNVILANGVSPMTGQLVLNGNPSSALGAAPKQYVDTEIASAVSTGLATKVSKIGDTMTGSLTMSGAGIQVILPNAPTLGTHAANKTYVDAADALRVLKAGDTMTGSLTMSGAGVQVILPNAPTIGTHAANKTYVDAAAAGAGSSVSAFNYTIPTSTISLTQTAGPAFNATLTFTAATSSQTEYYYGVFGGAVSLPVTEIFNDLFDDDEQIYPPRNNQAPSGVTILPTFIGTTPPTSQFVRPITAFVAGLGGSFTILGGDFTGVFIGPAGSNPGFSFQVENLVANYTINAVITGLGGTWTISGNHAVEFVVGDQITVTGNTGTGNGTYTIFSVANAGPNTNIVVTGTIPGGATADGTLSGTLNVTYTVASSSATGTTPLDTTTITINVLQSIPPVLVGSGDVYFIPTPTNTNELVTKAWTDALINRDVVTVTSYTISGFIAGGPGVGAWTVAGDVTDIFDFDNNVSVEFEVGGDTGVGGNGIYTVFSATFALGTTTIIVNETIPVTVAGDGTILLRTFKVPVYKVNNNRVWPFANGLKQYIVDDFVEETSIFTDNSHAITFTYTPPISAKLEFMVFRG